MVLDEQRVAAEPAAVGEQHALAIGGQVELPGVMAEVPHPDVIGGWLVLAYLLRHLVAALSELGPADGRMPSAGPM